MLWRRYTHCGHTRIMAALGSMATPTVTVLTRTDLLLLLMWLSGLVGFAGSVLGLKTA